MVLEASPTGKKKKSGGEEEAKAALGRWSLGHGNTWSSSSFAPLAGAPSLPRKIVRWKEDRRRRLQEFQPRRN